MRGGGGGLGDSSVCYLSMIIVRLIKSMSTLSNEKIEPTNPTERGIFFHTLVPYLFPNSQLILAGDFNCYDGSLHKMGGSASTDTRLTDLKSTNFLPDAWRLKQPKDRQFTRFNSDLSLASRLDSFLISRYLCAQVISCEILVNPSRLDSFLISRYLWAQVISCEIRPCVYSDHDFVYIEFNLQTAARRSAGVWKFNNSLLQDDKFCCAISELTDHFLRFPSSFPSDLIMWDSLKSNIKSFTI